MSADPRRITPDGSLTELFNRIRALERRVYRPHFAQISILNAAIAGTTNIDFAEAEFQTSDPDSFDYGLDTLGSGVHSIRILQGGLYAVTVSANIYDDATVGETIQLGDSNPLNLVATATGNYSWVVSNFPATAEGLENMAWFTEIQWGEEPGITFPACVPVFLKQGTSGPFHADVSLYIEQKSVEAIPLA